MLLGICFIDRGHEQESFSGGPVIAEQDITDSLPFSARQPRRYKSVAPIILLLDFPPLPALCGRVGYLQLDPETRTKSPTQPAIEQISITTRCGSRSTIKSWSALGVVSTVANRCRPLSAL
jgi:hypothetical protein